ncbi:MAG: hypothetical protein ACR652_10910 [Methylocystis sp.]|uniref:hypothetical protein n=1 Tax=Methylocystis sp. TaxID=1911079 RepID=UPI003DA468C0
MTVSVERIGRDGLIAVASAEVEIGKIPLRLNGLEVRRGMDGKLLIDAPGVAHGGAVMPAVELPDDLEHAIAREIAALV